MRFRALLSAPLLLVCAACAPALRPLPPMAPLPEPPAESPVPVEFRTELSEATDAGADIAWLRDRGLLVPVAGVRPAQIADTYHDARDGTRTHNAVDILAPRGTAVLAAEDGVVLRIGTNALGGNVVWAADVERRFAFYYAHLEHWARGLHEGQTVSRGDVIGYVGTSGNAPKDTPHLHFQVLRMVDAKRYANGPPVNPLPFFSQSGATR